MGFVCVFVVIMMGKWSELVSVSVLHVIVVASVGEQNVMSGDVKFLLAWCGMCVCCVVSLRI